MPGYCWLGNVGYCALTGYTCCCCLGWGTAAGYLGAVTVGYPSYPARPPFDDFGYPLPFTAGLGYPADFG